MSFGFLMEINLLVDFKMMNLLKEPLKPAKGKSNTKDSLKIFRKMEKENSQFSEGCIISDNLKMISFMVMDSYAILLLILSIKEIFNQVRNMELVNKLQLLEQNMKGNSKMISEVEKEN